MKIAFVLTWADTVGGTERTVLRQANWLSRRHQVEVIGVFRTRAELAFPVDPRVRVRHLVDLTRDVPRPSRGGLPDETCLALAAAPSRWVRREWEGAFNALADLELEHAFREIDADIVVATTPALIAVVTQLVPRHVVTVDQEHRVSELRGTSGAPLKIFTPRLDGLVLLSERTRTWFADLFGAAAPRLAVIPNAIEEGYRPQSTRETDTVVWAGRLTSEKQVDHAVAAFAQLSADFPTWRLRVFGGGDQAKIHRAIESFRLGDRVEVMGETPGLTFEWAKASIGLLTSKNEAFPMVIGEAMSAAVPVVAYDCPNGPAELIVDGENGFLAAPNNVLELAAALRKLMEDAALRHQMGEAAARHVEQFSADRVMPRWEAFYESLLAGRDEPGWNDRRRTAIAAAIARSAAHEDAAGRPAVADTVTVDLGAWAAGIEASMPDLVWTRGQLTRLLDDITPAETAVANLDLVVNALDSAGVDYFLVRDTAVAYRVAVREADRGRVLRSLADLYADRPTYLEAFASTGRTSGIWPVIAGPGGEAAGRAARLRVFEPVMTPSRTMRLGTVYGCSIEFWADSEDGTELVAPANTLFGDRLPAAAAVPAELKIDGRAYRTIAPFTKKLPSEVDFPVDVVYTWVDGDDPQWRARRGAALGLTDPVEGANGAARYRSRDELRYSLRSLDLFAPWVRRIWIVTDRQTPRWLDLRHPKIQLVDHRDIFSDPAALPTFNSHAIETQLHHIDGLAEHFLYFNDDVFLGRPVRPELFFTAGGLTKVFFSPTRVPPLPPHPDDEGFLAAAKNNRSLLETRFGRTLAHTFLHTAHAHRRSTLAAIETQFAGAVDQTMRGRVRASSDISLLSSFAHYYGLLTGSAVDATMRCTFINLGLREQHSRLDGLLAQRGHDVFCLNDFHDGAVPAEEQYQILEAFLGAYFPVASQFERGSVRNDQHRKDQQKRAPSASAAWRGGGQ